MAALTRNRISHVDQNYLRTETYVAANAPLITAQADIPLAQAWGGGLLAAVDGVRLAGSIHTGAVSTHDLLRMLSHGDNPTQLGEALAHRKAATTWPATSSTAAAATSAAPTTRE